MKRKSVLAIILFSIVIIIYFSSIEHEKDKQAEIALPSTHGLVVANQEKFSAWSVYWNLKDAEKEIELMGDNIDKLCYFAAYFNSQNELIMPQDTEEFFQKVKKEFKDNTWLHYITIVNDKVLLDGTSSLKDTELLYTLFSSEEAMNHHIQELLNLTIKGGYNGIEIDYEAIRSDQRLWKLFISFCNKLYKEADLKGIKMRVVLEPSTPFEELIFPEGPEYVIMCYNLYGTHSEPGPKANTEFITKLIKKVSGVPGKINFAIATGGFDWSSEGIVTSLTETQAYSLAMEYEVETLRDISSQCIVYKYEDSDNRQHEVWYADSVTLSYWSTIIRDSGDYGITIWRLGGNRRESDNRFLWSKKV